MYNMINLLLRNKLLTSNGTLIEKELELSSLHKSKFETNKSYHLIIVNNIKLKQCTMYNGSTYMNSHLHINILKNVKEKSLITYDRVPPHCGLNDCDVTDQHVTWPVDTCNRCGSSSF